MAQEKQGAKPASPETHAPAGAEHKKSSDGPKRKEYTPLPGGCHSWGCKSQSHRFNFCDEHYDQFKFGLIRKTGEPVPDYEKKFEHYQAWKARSRAHKVA